MRAIFMPNPPDSAGRIPFFVDQGKIYTAGVCSKSAVKTDAVADHAPGIPEGNTFKITRSTPPQEPFKDDDHYATKHRQWEQDLEKWKEKAAKERDVERETLAKAEAASKNGDVLVEYCFDTNDITVKHLQMASQPTTVAAERLSEEELSNFSKDPEESRRLQVGLRYAGERMSAMKEIIRQYEQYGVPLERELDLGYSIENIGATYTEVKSSRTGSLLDRSGELRDIPCFSIEDMHTGATVLGNGDGLIVPREVAFLIYQNAPDLTIGQAFSKLVYRKEDGALETVIDKADHQDPHKVAGAKDDLGEPLHNRAKIIKRGLNAMVTVWGEAPQAMGDVIKAVNTRDGELEISTKNIPLDLEYAKRLEAHRVYAMEEFYERSYQAYLAQQEQAKTANVEQAKEKSQQSGSPSGGIGGLQTEHNYHDFEAIKSLARQLDGTAEPTFRPKLPGAGGKDQRML